MPLRFFELDAFGGWVRVDSQEDNIYQAMNISGKKGLSKPHGFINYILTAFLSLYT